MKRDLAELAQSEFDVLIIGAGIYGATLAWESVLCGLKVALIDKGDFVSGTSSNSLKIIHGGLRYLQHADFARMRESIRERRILMHIAPHMVHPLPCVMPTYGHAIKGPEVMRIALWVNDLVGFDRNRLKDPNKHIPAGRILSRNELLDLVPYVDKNNLTGGAMWYDARMTNSERLALSFIMAAAERGVQAANYVKAEKFLTHNGRVIGAHVRDVLNDQSFDIRARITINTAGPWINNLLDGHSKRKIAFSTAMNLVVKRQLSRDIAFGAPSKFEFRDKDAIVNRGTRLLFIVPWRDVSLVGTAHRPYFGDAEDYRVTEQEIQEFLDEVNKALVGAQIQREDVTFFYGGLLPMAGINEQSGDVRLEKHFRILDHEKEDALAGLLSLVSVKYTTARGVAEETVKVMLEKLDMPIRKRKRRPIRIWGGEIDDYRQFLSDELARMNPQMDRHSFVHLLQTYGSRYQDVIHLAQEQPELLKPIAGTTPVTGAEVIFGVRHEMAHRLSDVIMRRTELGTIGHPGAEVLQACADLMAAELGWNEARKNQEIESVERIYQPVQTSEVSKTSAV